MAPSGPLDVLEVQGIASQRHCSGVLTMAQPHDTQNHEVLQEHPMITQLLAELQAIEEKEGGSPLLHTDRLNLSY
jgi:hypothetical protein